MDAFTTRDWEEVSRLFAAALEQPPERRTAFVRAADVDASVRAEVEALLVVSAAASDFFDDLAPDVGLPFAEVSPEAPTAAIRLASGERVGRFTIQEELGRGGMGVVYAAHDDRLDRRVALKFVDAEGEAEGVRARFLREARAASALDHPHICTIHDAGDTHEGCAYIVMACYDGETLHARLRRGAVPLDAALAIGGAIASALAAAHDANIVHRDLKPANVMLTPSHGVKLLDFGIAKLRAATALTSSDLALGTVAYVAPEQVRGDAVDGRADVWALGVVLYEMLAGRRPFEGACPASVLYGILESEPSPLDALAPDVPAPLVDLVGRCLRKNPAERPPAHAVLAAVQSLVASASPGARSASTRAEPADEETPTHETPDNETPDNETPDNETPLPRRTRARIAGIVAIGLVGLVAASLAWGWRGSTPSEDALPQATVVAVLPFGVPSDAGLDYLREGMVDLLSTQLDGVAGLRSVDPNRLLGVVGDDAVRDPGRADAMARRLGASRFILGQVIPLGDGFRLSATYYEAMTAPAARVQTVVPRPDALLDGVDRLARELVAGVLDAPDEQLASLAAHTTASFPALRAYLDGEQHARNGRFGDAIDAYTAAVAADSTFALAWYRLARAAGWTGDRTLNLQALERAVRYSPTLPTQTQAMIGAYDAFRNGSPREAERRYRAILQDAPDDAETWYLFGETLFHNNPPQGRSTAEARAAFARAAMYDPNNRELLVHLMDLAAREERWTALDTLTARYLRPDPGRIALRGPYRLLRALTLESSAVREDAWTALVEDGPAALYAALVRVGPQLVDLDVSRRLALLLTEPAYDVHWRVSGFVHVGLIDAARGRWTSAEQAFASADALVSGASAVPRALSVVASGASNAAVQAVYADLAERPITATTDVVTRAFLLGWMQAHRDDPDRFRPHRDRLDEASRTGPRRAEAAQLVTALDAAWALQNGRPRAALKRLDAMTIDTPFHVRESAPLRSLPFVRALRAEALAATGRVDEALRWYEAVHDGYYHWGTPALATTTLRRADLLARQGRTTEAEAAYRRVLALWAEADASFTPAVETVRQRLDAARRSSPSTNPPP